VNLQSTDFELLGLTAKFTQDRAVIDACWKNLQREIHPDKFVTQGAAAQRIAMQWSVRVNEAYQRLKAPLTRAAYLCELNGAPINAENNTTMPAAFLMQQMEWREALDEAHSLAELSVLSDQVASVQRATFKECGQLLDEHHDYSLAVQQVRALMFIEKFMRDVEARIDQIET
jgi:molecular chaperone HscB